MNMISYAVLFSDGDEMMSLCVEVKDDGASIARYCTVGYSDSIHSPLSSPNTSNKTRTSFFKDSARSFSYKEDSKSVWTDEIAQQAKKHSTSVKFTNWGSKCKGLRLSTSIPEAQITAEL